MSLIKKKSVNVKNVNLTSFRLIRQFVFSLYATQCEFELILT